MASARDRMRSSRGRASAPITSTKTSSPGTGIDDVNGMAGANGRPFAGWSAMAGPEPPPLRGSRSGAGVVTSGNGGGSAGAAGALVVVELKLTTTSGSPLRVITTTTPHTTTTAT